MNNLTGEQLLALNVQYSKDNGTPNTTIQTYLTYLFFSWQNIHSFQATTTLLSNFYLLFLRVGNPQIQAYLLKLGWFDKSMDLNNFQNQDTIKHTKADGTSVIPTLNNGIESTQLAEDGISGVNLKLADFEKYTDTHQDFKPIEILEKMDGLLRNPVLEWLEQNSTSLKQQVQGTGQFSSFWGF